MMTIILSACLIADPKVCKDYRLPLDGDMSAMQCAVNAPPFFAQWAEEHPAWRVMRWTCQPASLNDT
ncbi:MAG TPA: hypothetical protein VJ045_01565 [Hyphomicrobiaceae bacterium]|nr:hypothetical protein [Hyphomicrobiaceae bacterium]